MKKFVSIFLVILMITFSINVQAHASAKGPDTYGNNLNEKQKQMITPAKGKSSESQSDYGNRVKSLSQKEKDTQKQKDEKSYIVKFKSIDSNIEKRLANMNAKSIGKKENKAYKINGNKNSILEKLGDGCKLEYIEQDGKLTQSFTPNDTYYNSEQWNLKNINAPGAWDVTKGSQSIIVAVIDSGMDPYHPDFSGLRILNGYDYTLDSFDIWDSTGHGTSVTGIISATGNNSQGIAGIAWNISIMPLHVVYPDGSAYVSDVAQAIYDATDLGVDVINISLATGGYSSYLQDAIYYALVNGVTVVAAAGNDGTDLNEYPAAYSGVIGVGSVGSNNSHSYFSNYNEDVAFVAPGENIVSTTDPYYNDNYLYGYNSGTSFSAPHVAGVAALMKSLNPKLSPEAIYTILADTCLDLGSTGPDTYYGYGEINAGKALAEVLNSKANDSTIVGNTIPDLMFEGQSYNVTITVKNTGLDPWIKVRGYNLGGVGDSDPFAGTRQILSDTDCIVPGEQKDFTYTMVAPSQGLYTTDWQMMQENVEWFGQKLSKNVRVVTQSNYDKVKNFCTRFYTVLLNRQPDSSGLSYWTNSLLTNTQTGASALNTFVNSQEFKGRNTTNKEYIQILYRLIFGREADASGLNYWVGQLNDGVTRLYILHGFIVSAEFQNQCTDCGITRGDVSMPRIFDSNPNLAKFVTRLYRLCLNREPDADGGEYWASLLYYHKRTGADAVKGFVLSQEFQSKNLSDVEYVKILYRVAFGREADSSGEAYWLSLLQAGRTRLSVLAGFINSQEFLNICNTYGIIRGTI